MNLDSSIGRFLDAAIAIPCPVHDSGLSSEAVWFDLGIAEFDFHFVHGFGEIVRSEGGKQKNRSSRRGRAMLVVYQLNRKQASEWWNFGDEARCGIVLVRYRSANAQVHYGKFCLGISNRTN